MFQAVSQVAAEEDDDPMSLDTGIPAFPMFEESPKAASGNSGGSKLSRGKSSRLASSRTVSGHRAASPTAIVSGRGGPSLAARHTRNDLRNRRSSSIEMKTFAGPDPLQNGFDERPGTYRWDSTVADSSSEVPEGEGESGDGGGTDGNSEVMQPRGIGMPLRRKRTKMRFRPPPRPLDGGMLPGRPWFVIIPESKTHQVFDHVGDLLTLYVVVAMPLFVSFQHIESMHAEDWYAWNMGVDLLFIVDLIARFLTAYYDDTAGRMVFQPTSICRNYARGLLIPDLIASVPLTMILGIKMYTISNKVTRLARLPQTMRLIRSIKSLSEEAEEAHHKNILLAAYNLVKVVLYILLVMHWVACGWHLLADLENADMSWIVKDGLEGAHASKLYVTSVYWTVTTLSTVGYGDIFASTIAERTYCILVMLTGATMYALSIGAVSQIIASGMVRHSQSRRIERHAEAFVRKHKLPQDLAVQIMRTLNISGETPAMMHKRAQDTLELLPPNVRTSTLMCIYRKQIARIQFLRTRREVFPRFVTLLARSLHAHLFCEAGEEVMFEDGSAEDMIFLVRGRAIITRRGVEVGRMSAGSCFGVSAALQHGPRRHSVTCVTDCEMYTVEGKTLRVIARTFPEPVSELKAESQRALKRSSTLTTPTRTTTTTTAFPDRERDGGVENTASMLSVRPSDNSHSVVENGEGIIAGESGTVRGEIGTVRDVREGGGGMARSGSASSMGIVASSPLVTVTVPGSSVAAASRRESVTSVRLHEAPRSIQELTRCLSDAARVEDEVWERMQLLTSSLRAMRRCIDECSVAHGQVLNDIESEGNVLVNIGGQSLVNVESLAP